MTEIEKYQPPTTGTDLIAFAERASQIHGIAKALANTSFVPKAFQGKPDEITAAILAGDELDLPPMTALRAIDVINGTPAISANAQRGMAQSKGIEFEYLETTQTRCVARARRPGVAAWTEVTWDIDRATRLGVAGKDNWKKMPQSMLIARATSELCRMVAADVLFGMPYSQEELRDGDIGSTARPVAEAPPVVSRNAGPQPAQRTAQREPIKATLATPPPAPARPPVEAPKEIAPPPTESMQPRPGRNSGQEITENTRKAVMAAFNDINIRDRVARMQRISAILGWEVPSVNMLTEAEGKQVVHTLKNGQPASAASPDATKAAMDSWGTENLDWSDVEAPAAR